jgi:hypothetical protein
MNKPLLLSTSISKNRQVPPHLLLLTSNKDCHHISIPGELQLTMVAKGTWGKHATTNVTGMNLGPDPKRHETLIK